MTRFMGEAAGLNRDPAAPPAWLAGGIARLAGMTVEERRRSVRPVEATVGAAYGMGGVGVLCGADGAEVARVLLVSQGWATSVLLACEPVERVLEGIRTAVAESGLLAAG
jgi:hypothetical protein